MPTPWPIRLQPLNNGKGWYVLWIADRYSHVLGRRLTMPSGARTDLASVPALARGFVATWGLHGPAAIWHDYLYRARLPGITRKEADRVMLEFMTQDGVGGLQRRAIYAAVRLGGGRHWRSGNPEADKFREMH